MKCMCTQTRPRFILSSERVLGGLEFEPMLTPRKIIPSTGDLDSMSQECDKAETSASSISKFSVDGMR